MAELTFKSAGVSTKEIDLSGPSAVQPQGVPAGVIGTALKGPAFVPVTVATYQDFVAEFGPTDGKKFGPIAMHEWMRRSRSGTYVRVLGTGDGLRRDLTDANNSGRVNNAGFIVGSEQVQPLTVAGVTDGMVNANIHAGTFIGNGSAEGRTYFLGALMAETNGSTLLSGAGLVDSAAATGTIGITGGAGVFHHTDLVITDAEGTEKIYKFCNDDGSHWGGPALSSGDTFVEAMTTKIYVDATGLQPAIAAELKIAIDSANGHNAGTPGDKIIVTDTSPGGGVGSLSLEQAIEGASGNVSMVNTPSNPGITLTGFSGGDSSTVPIVRGVIMAPSGVVLALSCSEVAGANNAPAAGATGEFGAALDGGYHLGTVDLTGDADQFVMILNGHTNTPDNPNIITASLNPQRPDYFPNILNQDAGCIEHAGHYLYAHYDIHPSHAVVTGSQVLNVDNGHGVDPGTGVPNLGEVAAFLLTGSADHNRGNQGVPNYENFEDRYRTARSPWVTSQMFGGKPKNLFKVHALDDGTAGSGKFKITIDNVQASNSEATKYGTFDVLVRSMTDNDNDPVVFEKFAKLDLNPSSERYIARVIGDMYAYYDFDKPQGAQKLVIEGVHPSRSTYIRVEMDSTVDNGTIDATALPVGFRGHDHLITSGELGASGAATSSNEVGDGPLISPPLASILQPTIWNEVVQLPIPMRNNIKTGVSPKEKVNSALCWGVQFQVNDDVLQQNKNNKFDKSLLSFGKYFPDFQEVNLDVVAGDNAGTPDDALGAEWLTTVLDSDRFNNNAFSLENVEVLLESDGDVDNKQWAAAEYRRDGTLAQGGTTSRFLGRLNFQDDFTSLPMKKYMKFSFFLQGGFDGVNILDREKGKLSNLAAVREMIDSTQQGATKGPTVAAYRKALDVMQETADVDIKLLAIPGLRDPSIVDYAIDVVENRFDAMLIADAEEMDSENNLIVDSTNTNPSVTNTTDRLLGRNLDSSFAAVYYPDVVVNDPALGSAVVCPPSVAVLGAFALNDSVAHPWYAPAGFTRGALDTVIEAQVKLSRANLDTLYEADINPLAAFPHTPGVVVWGQKTLQKAKSSLDRVNVRRLLIEVRRRVRAVGNRILFEPNREATLARFSAAVNPILARIQAQQGLDKFKVIIDTTTTTQADVENNTVRGKIFLQPTRTVEFIALDFVVKNAGQFEV
ncbi:MAG: hypothetical protein CME70_06155 [Halobacteriovorax sp.]|nr:hypothetical protein [Halobacteriovorax sp.]